MCIIAYLIYLKVAFGDMHTHISSIKPIEKYEEMYREAVRAAPYFELSIECYHGSGESKSVTHAAVQQYRFDAWTDISPSPLDISTNRQYAFVRFYPVYEFATAKHLRRYKRFRRAFYKENRRDTKQEK